MPTRSAGLALPIALLSGRVFGQPHTWGRTRVGCCPQGAATLASRTLTALSVPHAALIACCRSPRSLRASRLLSQLFAARAGTSPPIWPYWPRPLLGAAHGFTLADHVVVVTTLALALAVWLPPALLSSALPANCTKCNVRTSPVSGRATIMAHAYAPLTSRPHPCRTSLPYCRMPAASTAPTTPRVASPPLHQTCTASLQGY